MTLLCRTSLCFVVMTLNICMLGQALAQKDARHGTHQELHTALQGIRKDYRIPGLSVVVSKGTTEHSFEVLFEHYSGHLSIGNEALVGAETLYPIASLSKVFSADLLLSLEKKGLLSVNDPIRRWLPNVTITESLRIKDILSHTLVGKGARSFFYDPRFSWLTHIIEKAGGASFERQLLAHLDTKYSTGHFFSYQFESLVEVMHKGSLASGHRYRGELELLHHDVGVSASAGLVAAPLGLLKAGGKIMEASKKSGGAAHVFTHYHPNSIYANGLFRQVFYGTQIHWGYGQYDGFAALWMMAPERELQLVMLANSNVLSDASRLIFGDVSSSPIALLFAKHFLCATNSCDLAFDLARAKLHRDVYFSRYQRDDYFAAREGLDRLYPSREAWLSRGDINLMHLSNYLFSVSLHKGYDKPNWLSRNTRLAHAKGSNSLNNRPYWYFYSGVTHERSDESSAAAASYRRLTQLSNMPNHWTVEEAKNWLERANIEQ